MTDVAEQQTPTEGRIERLRKSLADVRTRTVDIPIERWLMMAGALLIGIGLPLIILGWYGAAHTPYTFEQTPYVISGGLLGLAFVFLGGFVYFAYWMTRQVQETRRQADRAENAFRSLEETLAGIAGSNGQAKAAADDQPKQQDGVFYTTARGTMFHRPDCVVVQGRNDLKKVRGDTTDLTPCKICDPLGEEPAQPKRGRKSARRR